MQGTSHYVLALPSAFLRTMLEIFVKQMNDLQIAVVTYPLITSLSYKESKRTTAGGSLFMIPQ